jgi:transglutaminase-like putative cysteine protease
VLSQAGSGDTWSFLCRLTETIRLGFAYLRREETGVQTPLQTLRLGRGSCRDFAVLMAEAARSLGLAARFVSGYLRVPEGDAGLQAAGGATHAGLQVYLPGAGWIDFDPTSGTVGNRT